MIWLVLAPPGRVSRAAGLTVRAVRTRVLSALGHPTSREGVRASLLTGALLCREAEGILLRMVKSSYCMLVVGIGAGACGCGGSLDSSPTDAATADAKDAGVEPVDGSASRDVAAVDGSMVVLGDESDAEDCYSAQTCLWCSQDDKWHCQDLVLPQCPTGITAGSSCAGYDEGGGGGNLCFACSSEDAGIEWNCVQMSRWLAIPMGACSP